MVPQEVKRERKGSPWSKDSTATKAAEGSSSFTSVTASASPSWLDSYGGLLRFLPNLVLLLLYLVFISPIIFIVGMPCGIALSIYDLYIKDINVALNVDMRLLQEHHRVVASRRFPRVTRVTATIFSCGWIVLNMMWWLLGRWIIRPDFVFVAYLGTHRQNVVYWRPAISQYSILGSGPISIIVTPKAWGLSVILPIVPDNLTEQELRRLAHSVARSYPFTRSIALAGRLPSLFKRAGIKLEDPFVNGAIGTVVSMLIVAQELGRRAMLMKSTTTTTAGKKTQTLAEVEVQTKGLVVVHDDLSTTSSSSSVTTSTSTTPSHSDDEEEEEEEGEEKGVAKRKGASSTPTHHQPAAGHLDVSSSSASAAALCSGATIAVIGGGGLIGSLLVPPLSSVFERVIAIDPVFATTSTKQQQQQQHGGNVVYTAEMDAVKDADAVLVLTASGDDVAGYTRYVRPGQQWGDDTHPEMSRVVLSSLMEGGAVVHKVFVTMHGFRFLPEIPTLSKSSVPGCLLAALVHEAYGGREALSTVEVCKAYTDRMGVVADFRVHSHKRIDDSSSSKTGEGRRRRKRDEGVAPPTVFVGLATAAAAAATATLMAAMR